ncbi:MAG: organic solvent tolerance protein [Bdellovibrionales bacterium]|nr:organic solvent tolerance protein [Bdellovibrionales bacterium]
MVRRIAKLTFAATLLGAMVLSATASAKDLTNRLGVGYADQFGVTGGLPSLAVRYFPNSDVGISGQLGIDTQEDASKFGFLAKVFRIVFTEDNMNFYMGAGAGIISREQQNDNGDFDNESGFEVSGYVGGEWFFSGLESLGFSFEAGIGVTSIDSEVRFRTIGDSPVKAGITFYF